MFANAKQRAFEGVMTVLLVAAGHVVADLTKTAVRKYRTKSAE